MAISKPTNIPPKRPNTYRVAICHTKKAAAPLLKAFANGVQAAGDDVIIINPDTDLDALKHCDVSIQASAFNKNCSPGMSDNVLRERIQTKMRELGRRHLIMDTGCLNSVTHTQIGYEGIKGTAKFHNRNSPSDRFGSFNIPISDWRSAGNHILILGQSRYGISTQEMDIFTWYDQAIEVIKKHSNRPIVYRHHPKCLVDYANPHITSSRGATLAADLQNAWCTVSFTTNAVVEAISLGIPAFVADPRSIAYPVCGHDLSLIESPGVFERRQWFYDLAYAEWTQAEMALGIPWIHLRPYVNHFTG